VAGYHPSWGVAASAMSAALAVGPFAGASSLTAADLLRALPRAAYTTARANGARRVFDFSGHVARTAASAAAMAAAEGSGAGAAGDAAALRPLLGASMALAMRALRAHGAAAGAQPPAALKLTSVVLWGAPRAAEAAHALLPPLAAGGGGALLFDARAGGGGARAWSRGGAPAGALAAAARDGGGAAALAEAAAAGGAPLVVTHATALAPRRAPPVRLLVKGAPRAAAAAKDSEWVRARASLEAAAGADFEEVLLSERGALFEGLQTNFFALTADGALATAPDGAVLAGTVRALVLDVAAAAGVRVERAPPRLADARAWRGAFVCSTSRLVLPADEIAWDEEGAAGAPGARVAVKLPRDALVESIEALVRDAVDARSEDVEPVGGDAEGGGGEGGGEGGEGGGEGGAGAGAGGWEAEAAAAAAEARGGVARADARGARVAVETREGEAFDADVGSGGVVVRARDGGREAAFASLHAALLARSAAYRAWFAAAAAARLA